MTNGLDDCSSILDDHPIFSLSKSFTGALDQRDSSLELSTATLPNFTQTDPAYDGPTPSGRRQVMVLKDAEIIVAAGKEIRMASLGEAKLNRTTRKTFKTLHTPNVQFEIHQMSLNPSGKLLAVAGAFQVAVIVLPRSGCTRLVPETIDCKSVNLGQFYHGSTSAAPVVKIEWHPWGDAGSTLLVMTIDGKLREYDISVDTEEPQQVLSFVPEKRSKSFIAEDSSEREVASFSLGKGRADWGPLTIYAVMKSGDVYAICPYMPQNASIPSSYVHSLECFISAKQEFLAQQGTSTTTKNLSTLYDYQRKYVSALIKYLPPGTVFPAASRSVLMHPPNTIKSRPARQGPFLLQPSPRILEGSEGGDATDITYLVFGTDEEAGDGDGGETEHLGVVLIAFQDGKVDLCLDVEKVEARWESKHLPQPDLPMLAVYESIDLGLITTLTQLTESKVEAPILNLLQGNHPVFFIDPIYDDTIYVYHAFGVHLLHLGPVLQSLAVALRTGDSDTSLDTALQGSAGTTVRPILTTFSVERRCSNPVVAISIPNDVYLTYSIFVLTSAMRITSFPLNLRSEPSPSATSPPAVVHGQPVQEPKPWITALSGPPAYISLLGEAPYKPAAILSRATGLPSNPRLSLPPRSPGGNNDQFMLSPDTLRYIGTTVAQLSAQIHEVQLAYRDTQARSVLQRNELSRLVAKCKEMETLIASLKGSRRTATEDRFKDVQEEQKVLIARLDRMLQGLMARASPELSEHETKWFEELKRIREEISGMGKYDEGSLAARTKALEREYDRLMPHLKILKEKEKTQRTKFAEANKGLGFSQAFEFGERSIIERAKIMEVEEQILRLAAKLEVSLGRPPTPQST